MVNDPDESVVEHVVADPEYIAKGLYFWTPGLVELLVHLKDGSLAGKYCPTVVSLRFSTAYSLGVDSISVFIKVGNDNRMLEQRC